ncbi:Hypothetical predicted protein [Cloeon dipterum]|uniref:Peroxisome assembly protein 12 n=1 Tax=Cloeon dipterum TaxID=197152 RepID=A0A8S1CM64_9INSE|nr:Hypothetical predicted protein [Cloeon dipterum]
MAERGAFLTSTTVSRPSFFEVLAQENLASTIHPALKRIANFLAASNPRVYGWILQWFDEIYLVFNYCVQTHYLRNYGASFAETFYGLKRVSLNKPNAAFLTTKQKNLSLVVIVLIDYVKNKLALLIEEWKNRSNLEPPKALFLKYWANMQVLWRAVSLANLLSYMNGGTDYHSPLMRFAGVGLKNAEEETELRDTSNLSIWRRAIALIGPGLARCLEISAFTLQFLQWWHGDDGPRTKLVALPVPSAPPLLPGGQEYSGLCPLCLRPWNIETVLPVSGFVFCYKCIFQHLKETKRCPVTNYPATTDDLLRIYSMRNH